MRLIASNGRRLDYLEEAQALIASIQQTRYPEVPSADKIRLRELLHLEHQARELVRYGCREMLS